MTPPRAQRRLVDIPAANATLPAFLTTVEGASGLVIFAHGSGSSRFSPRNQYVAEALSAAGLATLLLDLLTRQENQVDEFTRQYRFDLRRLSDRLVAAIDWAGNQPWMRELRTGLFGASTGTAAALMAAVVRADRVGAVVSRGGRPDLAGEALQRVVAPTLLIVGELDEQVILLNQQAAERLRAPHKIEIVPGATHLFEEPGALESVANLARQWFLENLACTPHGAERPADRGP